MYQKFFLELFSIQFQEILLEILREVYLGVLSSFSQVISSKLASWVFIFEISSEISQEIYGISQRYLHKICQVILMDSLRKSSRDCPPRIIYRNFTRDLFRYYSIDCVKNFWGIIHEIQYGFFRSFSRHVSRWISKKIQEYRNIDFFAAIPTKNIAEIPPEIPCEYLPEILVGKCSEFLLEAPAEFLEKFFENSSRASLVKSSRDIPSGNSLKNSCLWNTQGTPLGISPGILLNIPIRKNSKTLVVFFHVLGHAF